MALVKCNECNNSVSEHASSCPQCGYPIGVGKITLIRKKKFIGSLVNYRIFKNGVEVGFLKNGASFSLNSDCDFNLRVMITEGTGPTLSGDLLVHKGMNQSFEVRPGMLSMKFIETND